ncbi:flagellar protein FlgN [Fulvimarina endophytica]|uniref:Flagellar protein FlgN n=1 Tax=Fulvimarina endophytica TaxID=2293836 RepID=A0A371X090_9HYPH|nr:flagellar protein FlgN [Fulvimarina endophytica]RFC62640.1 flagellar protein FlgN [Fulvimarina endophytica]
MQTAFSNAFDRLEAVLARETHALENGLAIDLMETTGRKNQSLLELSRLARGVPAESLDAETRTRLALLRDALQTNQSILARHVKASHEVSGVMAKAIEDAESDGTYSSRPEFAGRIR